MKTRTLCVAWMVAGLACSPLAARHVSPNEQDAPQSDSSGTTANPALNDGTMGLGIGYLPADGGATIPTVTGDVWVANGNLALEGALGFGTFMGAPEGTNSAGGAENSASNDFGIAGGARYVIARPSRYLLLEGIGRLDYTNQYGVTPNRGTEVGEQDGTLGLYFGAGIEAFMPFLPDVSLSLDTGLNALFTGADAVSAGGSYNQTSVYLGGAGLGLPFTFSVHAYF